MKLFIYEPTGSAYWVEVYDLTGEPDPNKAICYAPLGKDGTINLDEGGEVDTELVGDEEIPAGGEFKTFNDLYEHIWNLHEAGKL